MLREGFLTIVTYKLYDKVYLSGFSREIKPIGWIDRQMNRQTDGYLDRDLLRKTGSHVYGGYQSAISKLVAQESQWYNSSTKLNPSNQESQCCKFQSESEGPRTRNSDVQRQKKMDVLAQAREQIHTS